MARTKQGGLPIWGNYRWTSSDCLSLVRWIPLIDDTTARDASYEQPTTRDNFVPQDVLDAAPMSYLSLLSDVQHRANTSSLQYLRGRNVMLIGCS